MRFHPRRPTAFSIACKQAPTAEAIPYHFEREPEASVFGGVRSVTKRKT